MPKTTKTRRIESEAGQAGLAQVPAGSDQPTYRLDVRTEPDA
jgi:hypothetical protein